MTDNIKTTYLSEQAKEVLFKKAISKLIERLNEEPKNVDVKLRLIDFYRKLGDLQKANEYLESLNIDKLNEYHQNLRSLTSPVLNTGLHQQLNPTPFLYLDNFLSDSALAKVWQTVEDSLSMAGKSTVFTSVAKASEQGTYNPETRSSEVFKTLDIKLIRQWFLPLITEKLELISSRLSLDHSSEPARKELQLTRHKHGDFFKTHQDISREKDKPESGRRITFVYYFFKEPKGFNGGDLLLYDTNQEDKSRPIDSFTRIVPKNNSIVFFPSDRFHQVTLINGEGEGIEHSRFTLNGWFH